jgi:single-strand DNA-binding protein
LLASSGDGGADAPTGKIAELIGGYLTTCRLVYLDGRLQTRAYDDPDAVRRWTTTIVVNRLQVLDYRPPEQRER